MIRIYKCPNCGGDMIYDAGTDSLKCPNCGTTAAVSALEGMREAGASTGFTGTEQEDNAGNGLKEFRCPACGGTIVTNENTSATTCSFCGSPTLIESRFEGEFKPSRVAPFMFDKKEAKNKFKNWKGAGGFLTPSSFKSNAALDKVSGVYVPYWLYSYDVEAQLTAECTRDTREKNGDQEVITTEHFNVFRRTRGRYENVPYDASEAMPDDSMATLEPYDYTQLREFAMPYLSGYAAEKFNFKAEELAEKVRESLTSDMIAASRATIEGYDSVDIKDAPVTFKNEKAEYVLIPIWTLIFKYGGKNYPLYMNGQNGKIDGMLPRSKGKTLILFAAAFVVFALIALLIGGVLL